MPLPVAGVEIGTASAGIKKPRGTDLALLCFPRPLPTATVFTQNRFAAAPVVIARKHLSHSGGLSQAWLINSGNANCGTGAQGLKTAKHSCISVAKQLACRPEQVLPFSTGVIMEPLPLVKLVRASKQARQQTAANGWQQAAKAIMTTDTYPKTAHRSLVLGGRQITLTGIAKGSGMIHPHMATMLAFIATDAHIAPRALQAALREAVRNTFNQISVDGDTSTNDAVALVATGHAGKPSKTHLPKWASALQELCAELADLIVSDGEGATCTAIVKASGFASNLLCRQVADSVACSPLIKTMLHARDPNLGRLLMAIGKVPGDYKPTAVTIRINGKLAFSHGRRTAGFTEQVARQQFANLPLCLEISAGKRQTYAQVTFCDLSAEYVSINSAYRS